MRPDGDHRVGDEEECDPLERVVEPVELADSLIARMTIALIRAENRCDHQHDARRATRKASTPIRALPELVVGGDRLAREELCEERPHQDDEAARFCIRSSLPATSPCVRSSTFSSATSAANTASSDGSWSVVRRLATES